MSRIPALLGASAGLLLWPGPAAATIETIALFTDNDQTGQPVEAYDGAVSARKH